jgi:uncharacterized protein YciW
VTRRPRFDVRHLAADLADLAEELRAAEESASELDRFDRVRSARTRLALILAHYDLLIDDPNPKPNPGTR